MTFVLQTTAGTNGETDPAIQSVLSRHQLQLQGKPLSFGSDTFYYYDVVEGQDSENLIQEMLKVPGVTAAYMKPIGSPPM